MSAVNQCHCAHQVCEERVPVRLCILTWMFARYMESIFVPTCAVAWRRRCWIIIMCHDVNWMLTDTDWDSESHWQIRLSSFIGTHCTVNHLQVLFTPFYKLPISNSNFDQLNSVRLNSVFNGQAEVNVQWSTLLGGIPLSRAPQIFRWNTRFAGTV